MIYFILSVTLIFIVWSEYSVGSTAYWRKYLYNNSELSFGGGAPAGITTTGSTIITNLENAPKSILLRRALLQWLGGIGIIVMAITLMPIMNVGGMLLLKV